MLHSVSVRLQEKLSSDVQLDYTWPIGLLSELIRLETFHLAFQGNAVNTFNEWIKYEKSTVLSSMTITIQDCPPDGSIEWALLDAALCNEKSFPNFSSLKIRCSLDGMSLPVRLGAQAAMYAQFSGLARGSRVRVRVSYEDFDFLGTFQDTLKCLSSTHHVTVGDANLL